MRENFRAMAKAYGRAVEEEGSGEDWFNDLTMAACDFYNSGEEPADPLEKWAVRYGKEVARTGSGEDLVNAFTFYVAKWWKREGKKASQPVSAKDAFAEFNRILEQHKPKAKPRKKPSGKKGARQLGKDGPSILPGVGRVKPVPGCPCSVCVELAVIIEARGRDLMDATERGVTR